MSGEPGAVYALREGSQSKCTKITEGEVRKSPLLKLSSFSWLGSDRHPGLLEFKAPLGPAQATVLWMRGLVVAVMSRFVACWRRSVKSRNQPWGDIPDGYVQAAAVCAAHLSHRARVNGWRQVPHSAA